MVFEATSHLDRNVWQDTKVSAQQGHIAAEATRKTAHDIKVKVVELQQETSEGHDRLSSQVDQFRSQMVEAANGMTDEMAQTRKRLTKDGEERKEFEAGLQRLVEALPASIHEQLQSALYQFVADAIVQRSTYASFLCRKIMKANSEIRRPLCAPVKCSCSQSNTTTNHSASSRARFD